MKELRYATFTKWVKTAAMYLLHVVIATLVVVFVALLFGTGVEALNQRVGDFLFWAPVFPLEILLGLLLGFAVSKFLRSRSAKWAWVLPAFLLISDFPTHVRATGWSYTLSYLFAGKCSDCVEVAILVAPLYASIAYSLGAWVALRRSGGWTANTGRKESGPVRFVLMLGLYSASVVIAVFVVAFISVLGTMLVSHSTGNLVEVVFSRPYYAGEVAVALVGGSLVGSRIRADLAKWVWVLPSISLFIFLLVVIYRARSTVQIGTTEGLWSQFFTSACANPHIACPQEMFGTCPFLSSLAYSLGAWIVLRFKASQIRVQSSKST